MGDPSHMSQLLKGAKSWNSWRKANSHISIDLSGEDLSKLTLGIDDQAAAAGTPFKNHSWTFINRELIGYDCFPIDFSGADLRGVKIKNGTGCDFSSANLEDAQLHQSHLIRANFSKAILDGADLSDANLFECNLTRTSFVETNLTGCKLDNANVYGAAVWNAQGEPSSQNNLIISPPGHALLTLDRIELAQFVFLLVRNRKIRDVITTLSSKSVLILGRFSDERKSILDALSNKIRNRNMLPIIFDWQPSENRDLTETVQLLASLCRFVFADITDAKSIPQELSHIIPYFPSVPIQPIILTSQRPYAMFEHWRRYSSVLPEFSYDSKEHLLVNFDERLLKSIEGWEQRNNEDKTLNDKLEVEVNQLREELYRLQESNRN